MDNIVEILKTGNVAAIKTDTVYGLVCNAFDKVATAKIYTIKNREVKKPLSIFVKSIDEVKKYVDESNLNDKVLDIMKKYWPGALTIIFKKKGDTFDHITCGKDGIGIRIPNDDALLHILNEIDFPLAETSCNISGEKEYRSANEIREKLGDKIDLIVDGGEVTNNTPSTVISVENNNIKILRKGDIVIDE